ncbi:MAG: hypothetical protein ACREI3_11060, partial [Nitrospirales bacterium]
MITEETMLRPDNPLNPINSVDPRNPFNPINSVDPGNPTNPINQYSPNNPFNPVNRYHPDNPLNPANRYNPNVPFRPLGDSMCRRDEEAFAIACIRRPTPTAEGGELRDGETSVQVWD